ncbi:MAG: M48 family metalloprotease, partial [Candidatus Omnitrophota bacterium]
MKIRYIVLALCLLICFSSIAVIIFLGKPQDIVSLDVVTEVAERVIHHVDKTGKIVTSITDEEEMRIGDELHETLVRQGAPFVPEDDQLHIYVNQVGKRVAMNVKRQNIKYKFHVIRSPYPDAFSAPGGHVYITTGFLETLKSEAEMAAVLGHEITHIDAKHAIGRVQYKIASEKILGKNNDVLVDIAYQTLLVPGYS